MRYLLSRRAVTARNLEDFSVQHMDLGVELTHEAAREALAQRMELERAWLHAEFVELGGAWRTTRGDRLGRAAELVRQCTDGVYRSVDCDGVRWGWFRQN